MAKISRVKPTLRSFNDIWNILPPTTAIITIMSTYIANILNLFLDSQNGLFVAFCWVLVNFVVLLLLPACHHYNEILHIQQIYDVNQTKESSFFINDDEKAKKIITKENGIAYNWQTSTSWLLPFIHFIIIIIFLNFLYFFWFINRTFICSLITLLLMLCIRVTLLFCHHTSFTVFDYLKCKQSIVYARMFVSK